jgi:phage/plasmid-like protein (TIGR03299 family)
MSHDIEKMMFVGETPWHGLGTPVSEAITTAEAIKAAGLDWTVGLRNLQTMPEAGALMAAPTCNRCGEPESAHRELPEDEAEDNDATTRACPGPYSGSWLVPEGPRVVAARATVRNSDGRILGIVGPIYKPLQNAEAFAFFDRFIAAGEARYHTAGSLREGARVWILAQIAIDPIEVVPGDLVHRFLLLSNAHDGSMLVRCGFTDIRVVCANTLAQAHGDGASKLLRIRHTGDVAEALQDLHEVIDLANRGFRATLEQYQAMARKGISEADLDRYVKLVFRRGPGGDDNGGGEGGGFEGPREDGPIAPAPETGDAGKLILPKVKELFEKGRGTEIKGVRGTVWGAYNAVTEYLSYQRGRSADRRLDNLWFGDSVKISQRALVEGVRLVQS